VLVTEPPHDPRLRAVERVGQRCQVRSCGTTLDAYLTRITLGHLPAVPTKRYHPARGKEPMPPKIRLAAAVSDMGLSNCQQDSPRLGGLKRAAARVVAVRQ
jgi:hypothetical protein